MKKRLERNFWTGFLYLLISFVHVNLSAQTMDSLTDEELIRVFKYMHKEDVSNLRHPEVREHVFISNFSALVRIIETQGFPHLEVVPKFGKKRYIIVRCSQLILIHILQYKPELMLKHEIIRLFDVELKSGRMPAQVLQVPMTCMVGPDSTVNTFSREVKLKFYEAMQVWDIDFLHSNQSSKQ